MNEVIRKHLNRTMYNVCIDVSKKKKNISALDLFIIYKFGEEWCNSGDIIKGNIDLNGDGILKVYNSNKELYANIISKEFSWDINIA